MAGSAQEEYVKTRDGDIVFKKAHVHGLHNLFLMGRVRDQLDSMRRSHTHLVPTQAFAMHVP